MSIVAEWLSLILLGTGGIFCVIGGIGILRMPNFYCRCHAAGITDSAGAALILAGLAVHDGFTLVTFKLICVWLFLWLNSPAATHALAKAAYSRGLKAA